MNSVCVTVCVTFVFVNMEQLCECVIHLCGVVCAVHVNRSHVFKC